MAGRTVLVTGSISFRWPGRLRTLLIASAATLLSTGNAWADAWLPVYHGTLGTQRIGLTLRTSNTGSATADSRIEVVYYFYVKHLRNIPLKVIEHKGRRLTLAEADSAGVPIAIFHLEFPPDSEDLVGTWDSVDGKRNLPTRLTSTYSVSGEGAGRCGLDAAQTKHIEDRVRSFQQAFIKGDATRLKRDFQYDLRRNSPFLQGVADSVPHDMFCRDVGFLFGSFWFNYDGNLINPPR